MSDNASRLRALEDQQALPGFWADPDAARVSVQQIKILRNWLVPYESLNSRLAGALELAALLEADPDEAML